jgi:hypothetical protein
MAAAPLVVEAGELANSTVLIQHNIVILASRERVRIAPRRLDTRNGPR